MKKNKKLLDYIFWFVVYLLPILIYFTVSFRNAEAVGFFEFMQDFSPFPFVQEVFDHVTQTVFNTTFNLNAYLSYLVGVEMFHVLFDIVVFIPRLTHKLVARLCQDD